MPVYTDAKGNPIHVDDASPPPLTPTKPPNLVTKITHLPPHKAAAFGRSREVSSDLDSDFQHQVAIGQSITLPIQTVMPTTEAPPALSPGLSPALSPADISRPANVVTQQRGDATYATSVIPSELPKTLTDKATTLPISLDPFSATLQTFSTMPAMPPSDSTPVSPRPTPRLSLDLSQLPPQVQQQQQQQQQSTNVNTTPFKKPAKRNGKSPSPVANTTATKNALLAYNQYGEIVRMKDMLKPKDPSLLTIVDCLRLLEKVYGYDFRNKMAKVIECQMEERTHSSQDENSKPIGPPIRSLSSWDYADFPMSPNVETPEHQTTLVYSGPPRVLEIGCGNGAWCFASKERHPEWIIEGVDDVDHWSAARPDLTFRDFTTPPKVEEPQLPDYFRGFQLSQDHPEFTIRNLNALLAHSEPIPHNLYGLIRGRDVFDRVESYKEFLEDVRLILQPDGVVEFVELDPRPREDFNGVNVERKKDDGHVSAPMEDWTDKIVDRFKDPECDDVATSVPGWTERVKERLKANLRPKDGVPASQLKSWLEGAGFWDVKEIIFRLQIGGSSNAGKLMQQIVQRRVDMEEEIPLVSSPGVAASPECPLKIAQLMLRLKQLAKQLPKIEEDAISSGFYYFNLHIVTGRKPKYPRPGDLLLDGTRQEMTTSKYDAMAKLNDAKSNQWKRFDLDGKLTSMMKTLGAIHSSESTPTSRSPSKALVKGASEASSNDTISTTQA